eukprot:196352_1
MSSDDTFIEESEESSVNTKIFINECDIGSELVGNSLTSLACNECEKNTVGIVSNSQCVSCQNIDGITCDGSTILIISYNYWVDIDANMNIIANFCPNKFCCQNMNGCNYLKHINNKSTKLCAMNRNYSIPLCGGCNYGFSDVFGTNGCKYCDKNNYLYLLIPFTMAIILVFLLLILDAPNSSNSLIDTSKKKEEPINYSVRFLMDDLKAIQLCIFRPLLYFSQA